MMIQRPIASGGTAGFLSSLLGLVLCYFGLVVWIAAQGGGWAATLLAAASIIPLMVLAVLAVPNTLLGIFLGIALAYVARLGNRAIGILAALVLGPLGSVGLFYILIPAVFRHQPGENDFATLMENPYTAVGYGIVLGLLAWRAVRRIAK